MCVCVFLFFNLKKGATGDRLKEGSAINQSLSSLGNVISALADATKSKKKNHRAVQKLGADHVAEECACW